MIEVERREAAGQPMSYNPSIVCRFRETLLSWYAAAKRDLPWRRNRDPYAVWISEIMLQQTRVAAVIPYYTRFLQRFPDFQTLAEGPETDLLALWSGLGYYYRARNLQKAAQQMAEAGRFPELYDAIRALPGVGDYTAAAIASISFELPHAAVDGNVLRVISRLSNDRTDIASAQAKKQLTEQANQLLDAAHPGDYNQAMMELGATVCLPRNPQCLVCPVAEFCQARAHGTQNDLPVKRKSMRNAEELRTVYWIEQDGLLLAWQRPATAKLMPGFWELPEVEHLPGVTSTGLIDSFRHSITVHNYRFEVHGAAVPAVPGGCQWIAVSQLKTLPISSILRKAWKLAMARKFPSSPKTPIAESVAAR